MTYDVKMTVNGKAVSGKVEGRTLLVQFLREHLRLTGTHVGCDTTQCGCCVVHVDGKSVKSCTMLAAQADGAAVTTIEGLESGVQDLVFLPDGYPGTRHPVLIQKFRTVAHALKGHEQAARTLLQILRSNRTREMLEHQFRAPEQSVPGLFTRKIKGPARAMERLGESVAESVAEHPVPPRPGKVRQAILARTPPGSRSPTKAGRRPQKVAAFKTRTSRNAAR